jgi:hypothetical protein
MIFALIDFLATIVAIYFALEERLPNEWRILALVIAAFLIAAFIHHQMSYKRVKKNKTFTSDRFANFMADYISRSGSRRTIIVSDGLSWADDRKVRNALCKKGNRLEILMREENEKSAPLKAEGVLISTYGNVISPPVSRFTVVGDRHNCTVVVGWPVGNLHEVEEYETGRHPFVDAAWDVIETLRTAAQVRVENIPPPPP